MDKKAQAKRELRKAIIQDARSAFENWPQYLEEFESVLSVDEITTEARRLFDRMEDKRALTRTGKEGR